MAGKSSSRDSARFVLLFQKAHGHVASLQRVDDQIAALFEQRRKTLDDLRAVQAQINDEFQRVYELDRVVPADTLANDDEELEAELLPQSIVPIIRESKPALAAKLPVLQTAGN